MMKNLIVRFLDESNRQKEQYKERYEQCTNKDDRQIYRLAYLKALDVYTARYQMLLAFGYDVVPDENGNIIGIKEI